MNSFPNVPKHKLVRKVFKSLLNLRSAKENRPNAPVQPTGNRPCVDLPPELWILVIRHATSISPDPLDTSRTISFIDLPQSQIRRSQYCASMAQKRNLCLVNKFWNHYAREFLYEFVWINCATDAQLLARTLLRQATTTPIAASLCGGNGNGVCDGRHIRRLHIQTSTLDRCNPAHLRTILDFAPNLIVYSDYRSVRRNILEESCNPRSSPEELFKALAHPGNSLRRLSWTNYDDVFSFHLRMTPMIEATAANLGFLELTFCSSHLHQRSLPTSSTTPSVFTLTLPALRTLKVTLDNATFTVLSSWSLPVLQNLSVLSADFSYYGGSGFSDFFKVHGQKLLQLELRHSSSMIEEHYLTTPPPAGGHHNHIRPSLATWCPNLTDFICSSDAEWNWLNPDWIAPHVLLPSHPNIKFIGILDIDKRLIDDISYAPHSVNAGPLVSPDDNVDLDQDDDSDSVFFSLLQQIESLLQKTAFPNLQYIRDLSEKSDLMRRCVDIDPQNQKVANGGVAVAQQNRRVLKFWKRVLEKCKQRKVWLEDCDGVNITYNDLLRFGKRTRPAGQSDNASALVEARCTRYPSRG